MSRYLFVTDQELSAGYHGWLVKEMSKLGIPSAEASFISLVDGFAPSGPRGKVLGSQIKENAPAFYSKLSDSHAKVIVPLGGEAFRAVTGRQLPIEKARGYVYETADLGLVTWRTRGVVGQYKTTNAKKGYKKGDDRLGLITTEQMPELPSGAVVIPTYTVQYIITKRKKPFYAFAQDLRRAKRAAGGILQLVDKDFDKLRKFSTRPLRGWKPVSDQFAFDIETPMDSRDVRQISFSDGFTTMALMWDEEVRDYVAEYLGNPHYVKYAHNAMFDVPRLRDAGCPVIGVVVDTMILGQLVQPDLPKALGKMASLYLDAKEWKSAFEVDPDFYSAKDSFMTARMAFELMHRAEQLGMLPLAMIMMRTIPTLLSMNEKGIKVDIPRATTWAEGLKKQLEEYGIQWIKELSAFSPTPVNPLSSAQVSKLFYKELALEEQRNKQDGITADAEALFNLKKKYPKYAPLISILEKYRETNKQYGTYAKTLAGLFDTQQDRVHPQYLPGSNDGETFGRKGSASTGRLGVSNPNIQNQTPEARRVYVPDSPTHSFLEFDYSQAELRVIAAISGDQRLQDALGGDVHQITAERLGIPRPLAKNSIYASAYLGGAKTVQSMAKKNGVHLEIAAIKQAQALLRQEYAPMFAWQMAIVAEGTAKGYLVNPFGRVRFFYGGSDDGPEMADYNPQSTIADITWRVLTQVDDAAGEFGGRLITQVHDSFLVMVESEWVERAAIRIRQILEQPFNEVAPGFVIPTTMKLGAPGASWGELEKHDGFHVNTVDGLTG